MSGGRQQGGFTVLEIVVTLAVVAIVVGGAALNLSAVHREDRLQRAASRFQVDARAAFRKALVSQKEHIMLLERERFGMATEGAPARWFNLPGEMSLEVRKWGAKDWDAPRGAVLWNFRPGRPCEPISVRFVSEDGMHALHFDALTATPRDQEVSVSAP